MGALTRGNPGALEEVQFAVKAAASARLSPGAELGGTEHRRELGRLVTMAADIGEVVVSSMLHTIRYVEDFLGTILQHRAELVRALRIQRCCMYGVLFRKPCWVVVPTHGVLARKGVPALRCVQHV